MSKRAIPRTGQWVEVASVRGGAWSTVKVIYTNECCFGYRLPVSKTEDFKLYGSPLWRWPAYAKETTDGK